MYDAASKDCRDLDIVLLDKGNNFTRAAYKLKLFSYHKMSTIQEYHLGQVNLALLFKDLQVSVRIFTWWELQIQDLKSWFLQLSLKRMQSKVQFKHLINCASKLLIDYVDQTYEM